MCAYACAGAYLCSRACLHTGATRVPPPPARGRAPTSVCACTRRPGWAGVLGRAHTHVRGCPHMQPCTLRLPGRTLHAGPCVSALLGNDSRAHRGSGDSVLDSCLSPPPPAGPAIAATWSLQDLSCSQPGRTQPGAGAPRRAAGSSAGGTCPFSGLLWAVGTAGSLGGHGDPGAFGHAGGGTLRHSGWHHARCDSHPSWALGSGSGMFPGVFRVVPAVRSPGRTRCAAPGQRCQVLPRVPAWEGSPLCRGHLRSCYLWVCPVGRSRQHAWHWASPIPLPRLLPPTQCLRPAAAPRPIPAPWRGICLLLTRSFPDLTCRCPWGGLQAPVQHQHQTWPGLLHLPWVCRGSGVRQWLHLPLALSHHWHRALQLLRLPALRLLGVQGATASHRQHRGPGHGRGAGAGGCREERGSCQGPRTPAPLARADGVLPAHWAGLCICSHSPGTGWGPRQGLAAGTWGAVPAVSGAVRCLGRCAMALAASVSQSEVEPLPPPRSPRSQALLARFAFAMTGAATPALPSSAWLC